MADITYGPVGGKDCKLYYNTGSHGTPVWVEIVKAIDVSASLSKGEADISGRYSSWKQSLAALKELEITLGYLHVRGPDTVFDALLNSFVNDVPIEFAVMDGAITLSKAQGIRAYCQVFTLDPSQDLEDGAKYELTLKPTYKEDPAGTLVSPDWYEVP